jgi:hypothetical protein
MWKMSFPPDVVVSICSVRLLKPIPLLLRAVIVSMRCRRERPSRSRRQTTRTSPFLSYEKAWSSPLRSVVDPEAVSVNILSQQAALRASRWRSRVCSVVETRAYPISIGNSLS